jgi:hypothetical protein
VRQDAAPRSSRRARNVPNPIAADTAVIYTNETNFDLRQTVNEPRVFGLRVSYRFANPSAASVD